MGDIVEDLEAEDTALSLRAAMYIRIKRRTEEDLRAELKRANERLYEARGQQQHKGNTP